MKVQKILLFLISISFIFMFGVVMSRLIYADPPDFPPGGGSDVCDGIGYCGDPCASNPDCHGSPGGISITCTGCQSSYLWMDNLGTINYYCVDNNQLCGPNQTCSNGTCIDTTPTCSGCQAWTGTACADNNAYCSGGLICNNGACVLPSPTPTPGNLACNAVS